MASGSAGGQASGLAPSLRLGAISPGETDWYLPCPYREGNGTGDIRIESGGGVGLVFLRGSRPPRGDDGFDSAVTNFDITANGGVVVVGGPLLPFAALISTEYPERSDSRRRGGRVEEKGRLRDSRRFLGSQNAKAGLGEVAAVVIFTVLSVRE